MSETPKTSIGLKVVGPSHAAVMAHLHEKTIGGGWSAESVQRLLQLPAAFAVLAHAPDMSDPTGFALCVPAGEAVEIAAIGVLPSARRQSLGRSMIDRLLAHAAKAGFEDCLLEVAADNSAAAGLYLDCGFEEYGNRRNYYRRSGGVSVDARLFRRRIAD